MKQLRWLIIALFTGAAALFNIERLDYGIYRDIVNIESFVYGLVCIIVAALIGLPRLSRYPILLPLVVALAIYLLGKVLLGNHPLWGGIYTYLAIAEVNLIALLTYIAHGLARRLNDFEDAVENITLSNGSRRAQSMQEAHDEVQYHLLVNRRHERPFSVAVVETCPDSVQVALNEIVMDVQKAMMTRYVTTAIGGTIDDIIRRTDLMIVDPKKNRYIILFPEIDNQALESLVNRIQAATEKKLGVSVQFGKASFPDEGMTFEELVHKAEQDLHKLSAVDKLPIKQAN